MNDVKHRPIFTVTFAMFSGTPVAVRHVATGMRETACGLRSENVELHLDHELDVEVNCTTCTSTDKME